MEVGEGEVAERMTLEELELVVASGIGSPAESPLLGFVASFRYQYLLEDFDVGAFVAGFVVGFVGVTEERQEEVEDASSSSYSCSFPVLELLAFVADAF